MSDLKAWREVLFICDFEIITYFILLWYLLRILTSHQLSGSKDLTSKNKSYFSYKYALPEITISTTQQVIKAKSSVLLNKLYAQTRNGQNEVHLKFCYCCFFLSILLFFFISAVFNTTFTYAAPKPPFSTLGILHSEARFGYLVLALFTVIMSLVFNKLSYCSSV